MGLDTTAEETTSKGRIDMTVKLDNNIYIVEFKTEKSGKKPLDQIKEKNEEIKKDFTSNDKNKNTNKNTSQNKKIIYIIGVGFNGQKREISYWIVEEMRYLKS